MLTDSGLPRQGNIKYLAVARAGSKDIVASYVSDSKETSQQYDQSVMEVLSAPSLENNTAPGGRYRLAGEVNAFNFTLDEERRVYILISGLEYPERLAFKLIHDMTARFKEEFGAASYSSPAGGLDSKARKFFQGLVQQYDDPTKIDKLAQVQGKVAQVTKKMGDNVNGVLDNVTKARQIEESSNILRDQAEGFRGQATSLKRRELFRKYQTTAMVVCFVLLILIILIIAFTGPAATSGGPSPTSPPTGTSPPTMPPT